MKIDAIVLSAGVGSRMAADKPKQLLEIGGIPILIHPLLVLQKIDEIQEIKIPCVPEYIEDMERLVKEYGITKAVCFNGGDTRQESVFKSIRSITTERVLIHETSRPFLTRKFVEGIIHVEFGCVVPTIPVSASVVGFVDPPVYPTRDKLHFVQFPQVYNTSELLNAHIHTMELGLEFPEDSSLMNAMGHKILYVPGRYNFIKITREPDLVMAEALYHRYFKEEVHAD